MLTIEEAVEAARQRKEEVDWQPVQHCCHVFAESGEDLLAGIDLGEGTSDDETFHRFIDVGTNISECQVAMGPLEGAILFLEGLNYADRRSVDEDDNLAERWEAGDRDGIEEHLLIVMVWADATAHTYTVQIHSDQREFGEPVQQDDAHPLATAVLRLGVAYTTPEDTINEGLKAHVEMMRQDPNAVEQATARIHGVSPVEQLLQALGITGVDPAALVEPPADTYNSVRLIDYIKGDES